MPYLSNKEIREAPTGYVPAQVFPDGRVLGPKCCGQPMDRDGGCSEGCCNDYKCATCGHRVRIEWPD